VEVRVYPRAKTARELILEYLGNRPGGCARLSDIMEALGLTFSTTYMNIWRLARKGFVKVIVDPLDWRRRIYCLDQENESIRIMKAEPPAG